MATIRKWRDKWQVQVRRKGCPHLSRTFTSRSDAIAWARHTEIQADRRLLAPDPKQLERITLGELVARYRDTITPRKRGRDIERIVLTAFLRHSICRKPLSDLSTTDFANYRDERLKKVTANTLAREFSPLHNLFELARDEWGVAIAQNPLAKVRLDKPANRRERRLRAGELERIIECCGTCKNSALLPIIKMALETGLRRSELLRCRWDAVDLEGRCLTVTETKNGHSRTIPLTRAAIGTLQQLPRANEYVFPITANALKLAWVRLVRRANVHDLHFHDLRHEAISRFFELGLTAPEVASISGHRDMRMLFRYSHPERQRVLRQLDAATLSTDERQPLPAPAKFVGPSRVINSPDRRRQQ